MERDVLIGHGISQFCKESFMDRADKFKVFIGKESQTIVVANPDKDLYMYDGQFLAPEEVAEVQIPYACKLLLQELTAMGFSISIITEDDD
jgi:DNA-directed RNA polymerase beta subunit